MLAGQNCQFGDKHGRERARHGFDTHSALKVRCTNVFEYVEGSFSCVYERFRCFSMYFREVSKCSPRNTDKEHCATEEAIISVCFGQRVPLSVLFQVRTRRHYSELLAGHGSWAPRSSWRKCSELPQPNTERRYDPGSSRMGPYCYAVS